MGYVRALGFGDKPDYSRLRRIFRDLFVRRGFDHDYVFDWTILKYMESLQEQPQGVSLAKPSINLSFLSFILERRSLSLPRTPKTYRYQAWNS